MIFLAVYNSPVIISFLNSQSYQIITLIIFYHHIHYQIKQTKKSALISFNCHVKQISTAELLQLSYKILFVLLDPLSF